MKAAVISDIHSNCFALSAVLEEIKASRVEHLFILGDIFGYYPWAVESYDLLEQIKIPISIVKGNHDELILSRSTDLTCYINPEYEHAISHNLFSLKHAGLLDWLANLPSFLKVNIDEKGFSLFHGTPVNPLNGRYLPDNEETLSWLPKSRNDILLLGHTHYPLIKSIANGGVVVNPGSVGQPRDGNVLPSWILIEGSEYSLRRTSYRIDRAVSLLNEMKWNYRSILALNKNYVGQLIS